MTPKQALDELTWANLTMYMAAIPKSEETGGKGNIEGENRNIEMVAPEDERDQLMRALGNI